MVAVGAGGSVVVVDDVEAVVVAGSNDVVVVGASPTVGATVSVELVPHDAFTMATTSIGAQIRTVPSRVISASV
jgi:hypothetical protein